MFLYKPRSGGNVIIIRISHMRREYVMYCNFQTESHTLGFITVWESIKDWGHLVVWVRSTQNNLTLPSRINQTETRFDENLQWKWQATHLNTDSIPFQWGCHILFCMTSISPGGAYFKREKNLIRVIFLWFLVIRLCYLPAGLLRNFSTWTKMKNWYYLVFRA